MNKKHDIFCYNVCIESKNYHEIILSIINNKELIFFVSVNKNLLRNMNSQVNLLFRAKKFIKESY